MLVPHDGPRDGEALPGPSPDFLGREEWVVDSGSNLLGNSWARVADVNQGLLVLVPRTHRDPAIPDPLKRELFKKFGSVEAARGEVRRGYGLGLYLVNLVATAHGGRAVVRDRVGGGTTFGLYLPRSGVPGSSGELVV